MRILLAALLLLSLSACHKYTCYKEDALGNRTYYHFKSYHEMEKWIQQVGGVTTCDMDE